MEVKLFTQTKNELQHLNYLKNYVNSLYDYESLQHFEIVNYEFPFKMTETKVLPYQPLDCNRFTEVISSLSESYEISKEFLKNWLLYIISSVTSEYIARLEIFIKKFDQAIGDYYSKDSKIAFIEKSIEELKANRKLEFRGGQSTLSFYDYSHFNFSRLSPCEYFHHIFSEIDCIYRDCLDSHLDTLKNILPDPQIHHEPELNMDSESIEIAIIEVVDYLSLKYMRQYANFLITDSVEEEKFTKLCHLDTKYLEALTVILISQDTISIIEEIFMAVSKRNKSFFQNLFTYFKKQKDLDYFFKDTAPNEFLRITNGVYQNLNLRRSTPSSLSSTFISYFEKSKHKYLNDK